jgi:hypothetical protein
MICIDLLHPAIVDTFPAKDLVKENKRLRASGKRRTRHLILCHPPGGWDGVIADIQKRRAALAAKE